MSEKPILFSGEMVRAILAGNKTQTRRVVKPQPVGDNGSGRWSFVASSTERASVDTWDFNIIDETGNVYTERGVEHSLVSRLKSPYGLSGDRLWVRETWSLADDDLWYRADTDEPERIRWKPSIFMPRWASRIMLEVVSVRVERLQNISEEDAEAEGIAPWADGGYRPAFHLLWNTINLKRGYPWSESPWVWVVEFRRVEVNRG